jgi:hypothetical protein
MEMGFTMNIFAWNWNCFHYAIGATKDYYHLRAVLFALSRVFPRHSHNFLPLMQENADIKMFENHRDSAFGDFLCGNESEEKQQNRDMITLDG